MRSLSVPCLGSPRRLLAAQRPPRAIPPEGGGGEVGGGRGGTACAALSLHHQHNLADVLTLRQEAVRVRRALEWEGLSHHRPELPRLDPLAERREVLVERALRVPEPEHVETDHRTRAA